MEKGIKVLLVEDDPSLGFVVKDNLELRGYQVSLATDGEMGWQAFESDTFHLCILDVMMPKVDGFSLLRKIRAKDQYTPVFMLTARTLLEDKLTGLSNGADDYIVKPFSMDELVLRMEVFLKRAKYTAIEPTKNRIELGGISFYPMELRLETTTGEQRLTQREADLLLLFCNHANAVVKREYILEQLWGTNDYFMGRSLDVFIARLRKILKSEPKINIINLHSVGFKFECPLV
jgi:DNA-binding response OmpR family regulator